MSIVSDLVFGLFLVAIIYLMVRPSSNGTAFVNAFGNFLSAIIGQATDIATADDSAGTTTSGN